MDWSRVRLTPKPHQRVGTSKLVAMPTVFLADEVGAGKTKQVIDACFELSRLNHIDAVIVIAPAFARSVWIDPDPVLGELSKHAWLETPFYTQEYHRKTKSLVEFRAALLFLVTNYEFIRRRERLEPLMEWAARRRTQLVVDESWMVQNPQAQQTKAVYQLRQACRGAWALNGTPGDPASLYSQFSILDKKILGFKNFYAFRAYHAKMGGYMNKQIVGWDRMDEFTAKTEPYALRRLTRDCFDLGDPPIHTQIEVPLSRELWTKCYKPMRDDLVAWLNTEEASIAGQAGVKALRLAQLTAGFLGGVEQLAGDEDQLSLEAPDRRAIREVGSEKLKAVLGYLERNPVEKAVLWGRFRPEIERVAQHLQEAYPSTVVRKLYGGQTQEERHEVKQLLAPSGDTRPAFVVGSPQAGGAGLNLAAANLAIYMTNSFSLKDRLQSEGRLDRPGQTRRVTYLDVLATGPDGEKTVDHVVAAALRRKFDLANATADVWRKLLTEE